MASRALAVDPKKGAKEPTESVGSGPVEESVPPRIEETVDANQIAALAYQLWQERGCPSGSDQEDWFRAEQELKNRTGSVPTTT